MSPEFITLPGANDCAGISVESDSTRGPLDPWAERHEFAGKRSFPTPTKRLLIYGWFPFFWIYCDFLGRTPHVKCSEFGDCDIPDHAGMEVAKPRLRSFYSYCLLMGILLSRQKRAWSAKNGPKHFEGGFFVTSGKRTKENEKSF
jgi:hypothetical protein